MAVAGPNSPDSQYSPVAKPRVGGGGQTDLCKRCLAFVPPHTQEMFVELDGNMHE